MKNEDSMNDANELLDLLYIANREFMRNDMDSILRDISERSMCASLMHELRTLIRKSRFSEYYVDVEYNRNFNGVKTIIDDELVIIPITCDLIVHSRGENVRQDNLLAIEMKKSTAPQSEKDNDKKRLRLMTRDSFNDIWSNNGEILPEHICRYMVGFYYEINLPRREISTEIYYSGELYGKDVDSFEDCLNYESRIIKRGD